MMKILLITTSLIFLTACSNTVETNPIIIQKRPIVQNIPNELLDCRIQDLTRFDADNLTDNDVAEALIEFHKDNTNCYIDVQSIKKIQEETNLRTNALQ